MNRHDHDFKQEMKRLEIIYKLLSNKDLQGLRVLEVKEDIKKSLENISLIMEEKIQEFQ